MESATSASPTGRSCPASPPETPWPPASSSANAPPRSSRPSTHSDIDQGGMNNGDLESRGKRDVLFVRPCPQRPNRGRLSRPGDPHGLGDDVQATQAEMAAAQSAAPTGYRATHVSALPP